MSDVKKAKEKVAQMKKKFAAAEKRLKAANKNGSEKQIKLAEKYVKMWKNRYLRAIVDLKNAKEAAPKTKVNVKKAATFTTLAVAVVGLVVAGGVIIGKKKEGEQGQPATDSV